MIVVNKHTHTPTPDDVYIGRPSKWGNPFALRPGRDRADVVARYRTWIMTQPHLLADLHELRGKTLVCWCKPEACHGDVLVELVLALPPGDDPGFSA